MKGILVGVVCFVVFTLVYSWACFGPTFAAEKAIGLGAIKVVFNPIYWSVGALMILTGYLMDLTWRVGVR